MNRTPNHTLTGEPYTRTLAQRADLACEAIGRMASEGRGPRMSIPAGRNLHSTPPGDEDLFITDAIEDLQAEVERLTAERNRLWRQREGFDCHYAGPYAETSGIHCPLDEPCLRCQNERLTTDLAAARADARLTLRADDLERCAWLMERYGPDLWNPLTVNAIVQSLNAAALAALPPEEEA